MKTIVPEDGHVALYADNMTIMNVYVDGKLVAFEHFPHYQAVEEDSFCSVSCSSSAADVACSMYISSLDRETVPNLCIACDGSVKSSEPQEKENGECYAQDSNQQAFNGCNGYPEDKVSCWILMY